MPKKKPAASGFAILMAEIQEKRSRETGRRVGLKDVKDVAEPLWNAMSSEEKLDYNCRAKAHKKELQKVYKKQASDGTTVEGNMLLQQEAEEKVKQMAQDIRQFIGLFRNEGFDKDYVARKHIYLVSTNVLVVTDKGDHIPIEIGIAKYSIANGVMNSYHRIIGDGLPPPGYAGEAKIHSEDTHKLLSNEKKAIKEHGEKNASKIWKEIHAFIGPSSGELPPFFCLRDVMDQNFDCLSWILINAGDPDCVANKLKVWDLSQLLLEMRCAVDSIGSFQTSAITYFHATETLKKNTFDYEPNTRCEFHEDVDSAFCALGCVRRLCFLMSDMLCDVYDVIKTDKHLPCIGKEQNFCEVYNPCKNESKDFLERDIPEQIASQATGSSRASCLSKSSLNELESISDDDDDEYGYPYSRSLRTPIDRMAQLRLASNLKDDSNDSPRQPHISPSTFCQLKNKTSIAGAPVLGIGRGQIQK